MKRHLTKTRILFYMILLAIAGMVVLPATYARYRTQVQGNGTASIAAWGSASTISKITIDVSQLYPGSEQAYRFEITNTKDTIVSDTAQEYSILVETTGNLPLEFALAPEGQAAQGSQFVAGTGNLAVKEGKAKADGGFLPAGTTVTHTYTLTASWPKGSTAADYSDEIDLVTLTVDAVQASPASN